MSGVINILDKQTINKIAAGEVIERPAAIVKELVENSIDSGANIIVIEIKDGGISYIRVTDNGSGINKEYVSTAFLRHATSKIKDDKDLFNINSLGFRGEALSSISGISKTELVTKEKGQLIGCKYVIEGGEEILSEDIAAQDGTTFIIRDIFFNVPARKKFLKSATTEAGYIGDFIEKLAISHPNISFKFINNNQIKFQTNGTGNIKDMIYYIYGKEVAQNIVNVNIERGNIYIKGFIGKPIISRGNRGYENYFINNRYVKNSIINKAIEEAYKPYTMTHKYPFCLLYLEIDNEFVDVNVHPAKMEVRFANSDEVYRAVYHCIKDGLADKELIQPITLENDEDLNEKNKKYWGKKTIKYDENIYKVEDTEDMKVFEKDNDKSVYFPTNSLNKNSLSKNLVKDNNKEKESKVYPIVNSLEKKDNKKLEKIDKSYDFKINDENKKDEQISLFKEGFLAKEARKNLRIIGQVFSTYWIVEFDNNMFIIDQHAAHEKVIYERLMKSIDFLECPSQIVNPPIIISLNMNEEEILKSIMPKLNKMGFEIESFGNREYFIRAVPNNMLNIAQKDILIELIDEFSKKDISNESIIASKIASMSCKAAIKGNNNITYEEINALIDELMKLENPYHCPHGRPVIISMTKEELAKKFKR